MAKKKFKPGDKIDIWDEDIKLWIRVCAFIETLTIQHGAKAGEPFKLEEFQIKIVKAICSDKYHLIADTMARGNGKTALLAAIIVAAVVGPLAVRNSEIPVVASDKGQAGICCEMALMFLDDFRRAEPDRYRVRDNKDEGIRIHDRYNNIVVKAVSADPRSKHGAGFKIAIMDEPAQWMPAGEKVWNAMIGSRGKQKDSKVIAIGTLPDSEHHYFSKAIAVGQTKKGRKKAKIWATQFSADKDADVFDWEQIKKANPMVEVMPELKKVIKAEMEAIRLGEGSKSSFRAYRMNMGTMETTDVEYLLGDNTLEVWDTCVMEDNEFNEKHPRAGEFFLSFDLGEARSLTSASMYWWQTGRYETYSAIPVNAELTIEDREREDGNVGVYNSAIKNGEMRAFAGRITPVDQFLDWIANDVLKDANGNTLQPQKIFADRYKQEQCTQALMNLNNGWHKKVEYRAAGAGPDGKADVTNFRREIFNGSLKSALSFTMVSALRDARIKRDNNGNPSLSKDRSRGRIDPCQAAVMCVSAGYRAKYPDPNKKRGNNISSYVWS